MKHQPTPWSNVPTTSIPCDECSGVGSFCSVARVSGEATDAEWIEMECDECHGTGEIECDPRCPCCERDLVGDRCEGCEEQFVEVEHLGVGRIAA